MSETNKLLRNLPKIDRVLHDLQSKISADIPPVLIKLAVQNTIDTKRKLILSGELKNLPTKQEEWEEIFISAIHQKNRPNYQRVINATGVVVHTNLGRSLLGTESVAALQTAGGCYTNLEYDLSTGKRGSRYSLVEEILCDLTGAESAIVVNNNAAAVLLALNTLSFHSETIVSRGQLVEIGGSFRIPDVMSRSGALMVEVGATNRTHLSDYEEVIGENTSLLLKVHTSNFRVIGFTSEVPVVEMVRLGKKYSIPVMDDLGSGSLIDLSPWGLPKEPTVQEIVKDGVDVVTFSGDKLLGGPQAGIIVGRKEIVNRIKKNPMNRALRIDKFTLAALETVLRNYYDMDQALRKVPTLAMLTSDSETIKKKGQNILRRLGGAKKNKAMIQLLPTISKVGGGAMPEYGLDSWALVLDPGSRSASFLEKHFRSKEIPLIGRIEDEKMVLDLRTVQEADMPLLVDHLKTFSSEFTN
jgi:L-seryl-tRNA(Ser) seleniumtransferase